MCVELEKFYPGDGKKADPDSTNSCRLLLSLPRAIRVVAKVPSSSRTKRQAAEHPCQHIWLLPLQTGQE